jgi:hypothetical protein
LANTNFKQAANIGYKVPTGFNHMSVRATGDIAVLCFRDRSLSTDKVLLSLLTDREEQSKAGREVFCDQTRHGKVKKSGRREINHNLEKTHHQDGL